MINCPDCAAAVQVSDGLRLSEVLECGECHVELEVLSLEPVMIGIAPEVEEDWGE